MKRYFLVSGLLVLGLLFNVGLANAGDLSTTAVANAGFDKLNSADQAAIIKTIADQAAQNAVQNKVKTVDEATKWVNLGQSLGASVAATAKELGVAANDFVQTPVGQIASAVIIWKLIGRELVHVFGSIVFLIAGISIVTYLMKRALTTEEWKPNEAGKMVLINVTRENMSDGSQQFLYFIAYAIVCLASLIILLTM